MEDEAAAVEDLHSIPVATNEAHPDARTHVLAHQHKRYDVVNLMRRRPCRVAGAVVGGIFHAAQLECQLAAVEI